MSRGGIVAPELPEKSHILWVSLEMYSIQHLDTPPPPRLMLDPPPSETLENNSFL